MANPFVNRIIGYGTKAADQFEANPLNFRKHPERQRRAVQASLRELGWIGVVVENRRSGRLIDGHERVWQALKNNEDVPYIEVDLSEAEERLALATFDPITYMAETDSEILDELLRSVNTGEEALQELLAGLAEENGLYGDSKKDVDAEPQIDKAAELQAKWGTSLGQLWVCDDHRIICGDSTDKSVVDRLMQGEKPKLMVTDPPYGVEYDPAWRAEAGINKNQDKMGKVSNDDRFDWSDAYRLSEAQVCYVWHAGRYSDEVAQSIKSCGYEIVSQIIWVKDRFALSRGDYHWQHEPCWYAVKKGSNHNWQGARDQATTWKIDRADDSGHGHGTQKPIECMSRPIQNNTMTGEIVYDPFLGSGTTLIACSQLDRLCRGVELDPRYLGVILQRWADATGKTPVRVE